MPANPKYLTNSPWQQFAKLSSGILGGYAISALLHAVLLQWFPFYSEILVTTIISLFIMWCILLIIPYLFENGWKVFGIYSMCILTLSTLYFLGN